ncbi:hypothetical protein V7094_29070, partial [Priestia megaterium]|uniref:phage lytic cycle repressor MrpR family protein n=1 Tax=Priestia megaterium TaxID=1404 RepID=UPI002FFF45C1
AKGEPYAESTKRVVKVLFGKTAKIESDYNKDIYELDNNQFEEILLSLKAKTIRSLQNSISTLEQYIDFAIKEGKTKEGNIATKYNNKDRISHLLDKKAEESMYFTKKDLDTIAFRAENSQDGVIINLLSDGLSHRHKFIELINLKKQHLDKLNMVINVPELVDPDTGEIYPPRQVPVSEATVKMIDRAMDLSEKYVSITGKNRREYKIAESDYILRGLRDNYQIKWENVNQRILRISEIEGYDYLNATTISYSGQIHYVKEYMEDGMDLDSAIKQVIKRFNLGDNEATFFYLKGRFEKAKKVIKG